MNSIVHTDSETEPLDAGQGGEGGAFQIADAEYAVAVVPHLPEGAFEAGKRGDPGVDGLSASRTEQEADKRRDAYFPSPNDTAVDSAQASIAEHLRYVANCLQNNPSPDERRDLAGVLLDAAETLDGMCVFSD